MIDVHSSRTSRLLVTIRSFDRRRLFALALLYSALPFVASLVVAAHAGFDGQFVRTASVYLWTVGLFGGGLTFGWWAKRYPELWAKLRPVFDVTAEEYRAVISPRISRMYDLGRPLQWLPLVLSAAVIYDFVIEGVTVLIYVRGVPVPGEHVPLWLGAINYTFGVVSLVGLLIAVHVVAHHLRLVNEVMELPVRDVQTAADELVPLAWFHVVIAAGWYATFTVGLALLIAGPQEAWRAPFLTAGLLFVTLLGLVLFAVPQFFIHTGLQSAKRAIVTDLDEEYDELYEDVAATGDATESLDEVATQLDLLEARRRNVKEIRTWAYDLPGLLSLLVSSVVPLLLHLVQIL